MGIDGLSEIVFIFDTADKLVEKSQPFVGNARAIFRQGDSVVELDAPHMSFTMALRYMTHALQKTFKQQSTSNKAAKERTQANKF